jgi:hypothetical protein
MKDSTKPARKTIYGLWPEITEAVNRGEGWNLTQPAIKWRYYNGDAVVMKYHTAALKKRRREQERTEKVRQENRMAVKEVLMGMGDVISINQ